MRIAIPPLRGAAVQDERQLDGARHLTLDLHAAAGDWRGGVHVVLDRDGAAHEGEIDLRGPQGEWSGALRDGETSGSEGPLHLRARFQGDDPAEPELVVVLREDAQGDGFRLTCG